MTALPAQTEWLNGSRWSLVEIQSMDDTTYRPEADSMFTLEFQPQGLVTGQADCNRLTGNWVHAGKSRLRLSQLASTRALCPAQALADRFMRDLENTRSFVMQDGQLYLATFADGAILAFAPLPMPAPSPAFDCTRAQGQVENLLCEDTTLMAMDRYMDELYQGALANFAEDELPTLRAYQRGWISGRNDCWKDSDVRPCVMDAYRLRLSELEVKAGFLTVPAPVHYTCEDDSTITAYFYNDAIAPLAVLNMPQEQVFTWQQVAASGARYTGRNVEFRISGSAATLTTLDSATTCTVI